MIRITTDSGDLMRIDVTTSSTLVEPTEPNQRTGWRGHAYLESRLSVYVDLGQAEALLVQLQAAVEELRRRDGERVVAMDQLRDKTP